MPCRADLFQSESFVFIQSLTSTSLEVFSLLTSSHPMCVLVLLPLPPFSLCLSRFCCVCVCVVVWFSLVQFGYGGSGLFSKYRILNVHIFGTIPFAYLSTGVDRIHIIIIIIILIINPIHSGRQQPTTI